MNMWCDAFQLGALGRTQVRRPPEKLGLHEVGSRRVSTMVQCGLGRALGRKNGCLSLRRVLLDTGGRKLAEFSKAWRQGEGDHPGSDCGEADCSQGRYPRALPLGGGRPKLRLEPQWALLLQSIIVMGPALGLAENAVGLVDLPRALRASGLASASG